MKKSITGAVALLAGAFVAHSQGTVSFASYLSGAATYSVVTLNGTPVGGTGTTTSGDPATDIGNGSDWTVALYANTGAGDAANTLTQATLDGSPAPGTPVQTSFAGGYQGTWLSSAIADVPGQPTTGGTPATVQLYAWYNDGGTIGSYNAAVAAGVPAGFSGTGTVASTGGPQPSGPPATAPALPFASMGNVAMTTTIPEPSTIALGVMGASAFLLRLRRKQ